VGYLLKQQWLRMDRWPVSSHLWLVILIAFLVFSASVWLQGERTPAPQATGAIQHAVALHKDATFGYSISQSDVAEPAMFYAPLQIAFVAGVMSLDQNLAKSLSCFAWKSPNQKLNKALKANTAQSCEAAFRPFFFLQALILALVPFFAWLTAWALSGNKAVAWGAVVLVLLSGRQAFHVTSFSADVLSLPLFAGLLFALVANIQSQYWLWTIAVGFFCGLLALTEPIFAQLFYGLLVVLSYWHAAKAQNSRYFWQTAAMLVAPYLLVTAPWMWRNYWAFDTSALTTGYMASLLAERLAWNMLNGLEIAVSFVYSLATFGPDLAMAAYPQDAWQRLVPGAEGGVYTSATSLAQSSLVAAGSTSNHMTWLLSEELWPNFGKHVAVTFALIWRGLWIAGLWGLMVVPLTIAYFAVSISRRRTDIVMAFSACLYTMILFAVTTARQPDNGDIFIPLISVMVAMLAAEWIRHRQST
jgi:hypothetical protein